MRTGKKVHQFTPEEQFMHVRCIPIVYRLMYVHMYKWSTFEGLFELEFFVFRRKALFLIVTCKELMLFIWEQLSLTRLCHVS